MNQPLVNPKSEAEDEELQKLAAFYNETLGFCPNSIKTMHIRPQMAYSFIQMNKSVMQCEGKVTSALKRLIGFMSSYAAGCRYCQAHTMRAAERYGAPQAQLDNIWEYKTHPSFNDAERSALDFAVAASSIPNGVDENIKENLKRHWGDGEIVEILGVVALFGFLNRWNDSMGTKMELGALESGEKLLKNSGWSVGKH